jgi:hypothetical protein
VGSVNDYGFEPIAYPPTNVVSEGEKEKEKQLYNAREARFHLTK